MSDGNKLSNRVFLSDAPIASASEDILGWDRLASNIAKTVAETSNQKSIVIGIQGSWGSGKTSLLSLVEQNLKPDDGFILYQFNPWLFPDEDSVRNFFTEFLRAVGKKAKSNQKKRLSKLIRNYAHLGRMAGLSIETVNKILLLIMVILSLYGIVTSNAAFKWLMGIFLIMTVIALSLEKAGNWMISASDYLRNKVEFADMTSVEIKEKINEVLKAIDKRIVIFIDDVDRLAPKEICKIFQIIKNNGDLENVTYIVAYDEKVVKQALKKEYSDEFDSFPQKIIQITLNTPQADAAILENYFSNNLNNLLQNWPQNDLRKNWDVSRWSNYYFFYFQWWLTDLRIIKRIINAISASMPLIVNNGTLEVNPVDFLAIEIIRERFPILYDFIKSNKGIFVNISNPTKILGEEPGERKLLKEQYDNMIENQPNSQGPRLDRLLRDLFPRINHLDLGWGGALIENESWERNLLVCSESIFDRYFLYGNYQGDISTHNVDNLLLNIMNSNYVDEYLNKTQPTEEIVKILKKVRIMAMGQMDRSFPIRDLINFYFKAGDHLPPDQLRLVDIPMPFLLSNLIIELLEPYSLEIRSNIINGCIDETGSIFAAVSLLSRIEADIEENPSKAPFIEKSRFSQTKDNVTERALNWLAKDSSLIHSHFIYIVRRLKEWANPSEFEIKLNLLLKEDTNFKIFIARYLVRRESLKYGAVAGDIEYIIRFSGMEQISDMARIAQRVFNTTILGTDKEEIRRAFEIFRRDYRAFLDAGHKDKEW